MNSESRDASEEVSVFRPLRCLNRVQALGRRGLNEVALVMPL